jgi:hypothetical protein
MSRKPLNDAQILAKTNALLDVLQEKCWPGYEKKGMKTMFGKRYPNCVKKSKKKKRKKRKNEDLYPSSEKVLREIEEDEMRVLEDVLDDLDPANLPLNELFADKMRVIIPFPTIDPSTDLGKFAKFFENQEYEVDWEKGMVYAERDIRNSDDLLDSLIGMTQGQPEKKKVKKIQMKIGKLFPKIAQTVSNLDKLFQIIKKEGEGKAWYNDARQPGNVTGQVVQRALSDEQQKSWARLLEQMYHYIPSPGYFPAKWDETQEYCQKMSEYWQKNAGYIKQNINAIDDEKFSIIITRHPIDVLRMSDFQNITSCHSPASRTNAYQSYYKCAVAEAQGHGAVAYVVETDDLISWSGRKDMSIEEIEEEMQDGEIFYDDKREFAGSIEPISRTRIRHVRYFDTDEPKRYDDGQDVGMPEKRVYGADIPGFIDTVVDWSRRSQEEILAAAPREGNKINLSRFMIFGGSYEDTNSYDGREVLMTALMPNEEFTGYMSQNKDTEDDLDADLIGDIRGSYETQCQEIVNTFNQRAAVTKIDFEVQDDGGDGVYITGEAKVTIEWPVDEWTRLPTAIDRSVQYSDSAINDIYGDLFSDAPYMGRAGGTIFWVGRVNLEHPDLGGQGYFVDPDDFSNMCDKVDTIIDDRHDAWKEILSTYFRREGDMQGGEYMNLAIDIENGDFTSYEWDLETDGEYEDSYESYASYSFDYSLEDFGMSEEVMMQILNSRDYKIQLRRNLLEQPKKETDSEYFISMRAFARTYEQGEVRVTVTFSITRDEPDEMVTLFKELVEGDMDDEDNLTIMFNKTLAQLKTAMGSGVWPEEEGPATADINENLVKSWRQFYSS